MSYIILKKQLFLLFKRLLFILNNNLNEDIKQYFNNKFFNNIKKCKYYDCVKFFISLTIFYLKSIVQPNFKTIINYKEFRKFSTANINNKNKIELIKEILNDFLKIDYTYIFYEDLKIMLNFIINDIISGIYGLR